MDQRCLAEPVRETLLTITFPAKAFLRFWNNENRPQSGRRANPYQRDAVPHGRASEAISRIVGLNLKGGAGNDCTSRLSQGRRRQRHLLLWLRLVARSPSAILDRVPAGHGQRQA